MNPNKAYKFCPKCSEKLTIKSSNNLECIKCKFNLYINPSPCNTVILENENNEIMLVERKIDPKKGYWDLPGGFINPNETFEESVKREIREELNVDLTDIKIIGIYNDVYEFQNIIVPTICIFASAKPENYNFHPEDDIASYKFFKKNEVLKQKLAFASLKQGLRDYLKNNI